jgi:hypothetical protein
MTTCRPPAVGGLATPSDAYTGIPARPIRVSGLNLGPTYGYADQLSEPVDPAGAMS